MIEFCLRSLRRPAGEGKGHHGVGFQKCLPFAEDSIIAGNLEGAVASILNGWWSHWQGSHHTRIGLPSWIARKRPCLQSSAGHS